MTPMAMSFAAARGLPAFAAAKSAAKTVNTHNPAEIPGALFRNRFMANLHVLLLFGCLPRSDHRKYCTFHFSLSSTAFCRAGRVASELVRAVRPPVQPGSGLFKAGDKSW